MPDCPQLCLHRTCCSAATSPPTSMPNALAAAIGSARYACTSQGDAARFHTCRLWGPRHRRLSVMQCVMKRKITVASTPPWVPWPWAQAEMSHLCELGMRLGELQLDALPLADALQRQPHLRMSQDSTSTRCWAGAAVLCSKAACQSQAGMLVWPDDVHSGERHLPLCLSIAEVPSTGAAERTLTVSSS